MAQTLGERIFLAHLELSYRLGRKVTLAEFGEMVAAQLGREAPFTAAAVSRWESGAQAPALPIIEAIAAVTGSDPGWISHGSRSAAPPPARLSPGDRDAALREEPALPIVVPAPRLPRKRST